MRPLNGAGHNMSCRKIEMLAFETREAIVLEHLHDRLHGLGCNFAAAGVGDAERLEHVGRRSPPHAEFHAAVAEDIQRSHPLGHEEGMLEADQDHGKPKPDTARALAHR